MENNPDVKYYFDDDEFATKYEDLKYLTWSLLNNEGFVLSIDEIYYRGFNCQGDGASFDFELDIPLFIKKHSLKGFTILLNDIKNEKISIRIFSSTNEYANFYCHEKTRFTDFEWSGVGIDISRGNQIYGLINLLIYEVEKVRLEWCTSFYNSLQSCFEECHYPV